MKEIWSGKTSINKEMAQEAPDAKARIPERVQTVNREGQEWSPR